MRPVLACLVAALVCAADPLPQGVVARVDGTDITMVQLGREMLKREGTDALLNWMQGHLEKMDWDEVTDDAVILDVAGHQLRKRELAAMLAREKGGKVREQLIDIAIVEQAVAKAGIIIDDAAMASEFRLMERDFQRKMAGKGQGHIDFGSWLRVKEKMSVQEFLAQPAVRMLAGVHELVRREVRAENDDARLQAMLDADRERWDQRAGVDLSTIFLPWKKDASGVVTPEEQARLQSVANIIHRQLVTREVTFAKAWDAFAKAWDTYGADGRIGWVDAEGVRGDETLRRIPKPVVDRAFASDGPFPVQLPPHVHAAGIDIALVHGKRPARRVELAEVRERMIQELLEKDLEERTKDVVARLRKAANVEYGSMPAPTR
ncbi:MAG: hypothetical protein J0M00_16195 [Burkholderiales bacterium]|nr:hypothetical protein [Burkholderiales bacterium]